MCQCANIAVYQCHRQTTEHSPITVVILEGDQEVAVARKTNAIRKAKPSNGSAPLRSICPLRRSTTGKLCGYCTVRRTEGSLRSGKEGVVRM